MKLTEQKEILEFIYERERDGHNTMLPDVTTKQTNLSILEEKEFIDFNSETKRFILTFKGHVALAAWREHAAP